MNSTIEFNDIQALVRFGHGHLVDASFLLLDIVDATQAKHWLTNAPVSSAEIADAIPERALQIAFTMEGLRALGLKQEQVEGFSEEFHTGMSGDSSRSRRLGDIAENDPKSWSWGGNSQSQPHVLLMLYAKPGQLDTFRHELEDNNFIQGFRLNHQLKTVDTGGIEPFGFTDGISQPEIDWERSVATDFHSREDYSNRLALGEILLGYPNEYGEYTKRPLVSPVSSKKTSLPRAEDYPEMEDLGRNGSYLVLRQLHQDVPGFWQYMDQQVSGDPQQREELAGKMVGRQRDGTPLISDVHPIARNQLSAGAANEFDYDSDPHGYQCPIGAHIRRSNPRTGDFPADVQGFFSRLVRIFGFGRKYPGDDLVASTRFHRLLRRGRPYGEPISSSDALKSGSLNSERGLQFVCLAANISRQFEFVQNAWAIGPKFSGLQNEGDPLLGHRQPLASGGATDHFTQPNAQGPAHCSKGLPPFITVRGGGYFFLPGIRALRYIASNGDSSSDSTASDGD